MSDISLNNITSGFNLSKINDNFKRIQDTLNLDRLGIAGGGNTMGQDLDMNSFSIINTKTNMSDPSSLLSVRDGDIIYYNVSGDTLTGPMNVNGQQIYGLAYPRVASSPVRKDQLDNEISSRQAADASLQRQLNGINPPMGSAFSVISWHDQVVQNSITIPDNKNAWSFGPILTINEGQEVTIGDGSFWTVADGEVHQ